MGLTISVIALITIMIIIILIKAKKLARNIELAMQRRIRTPWYEDKPDHWPSRKTRISESNCNQNNLNFHKLLKVAVTATNMNVTYGNLNRQTESDDSEPIILYAQIYSLSNQ